MLNCKLSAIISFSALVLMGLFILISANFDIKEDGFKVIVIIGFIGVIAAVLSLNEKPKKEELKITDSKSEEL